MAIRRELESSDVACETLDVRDSLAVGSSLSVAGVPITGGGGGPVAPSSRSTQLIEFLNASGVNFVVDVAPAAGNITNVPSARGVGFARINPGANGAGMSIQTTDGFTKQISQVGLGPLTLEWIAKSASPNPTAIFDFTLRMLAGTIIQSGFGNGDCLGFTLGFAENGNANWFAVLNNAQRFNTGIVADNAFHRFTIVHTPSAPRVEWFIDGALVNTFNGVPSVNGLSVAICGSAKSISAGNNPELQLDYMYWDYEFSRP